MTVPFFHLSLHHFVFFPSSSSCIFNATHSIISALLCIIKYSVVASLAHPKNQCLTVYFVSLHILLLSRFRGKPMFAFDALVSTICSCIAIIDANFFGSILPCSHIWFFFIWFVIHFTLHLSCMYFFNIQFSDFPFLSVVVFSVSLSFLFFIVDFLAILHLIWILYWLLFPLVLLQLPFWLTVSQG